MVLAFNFNKMKTYVAIFLLFSFINVNAQKGKFYQSIWRGNENSEMAIQGDRYTYFEKGKLYYVLSNDNSDIYLDMNIEDPAVQNRILKEGLTVWINMDGKLVKKMGIRFPIGSQYAGRRNGSDYSNVKVNPDGSLVTPLSQANTIELSGFSSEDSRRFPSDNTDNFRGYVKYDNEGILHYRLIMPVAKLPVRNSKEGDGAMPFNLAIEYGAPPVMNSGNRPSSSEFSMSPPGGSRGGSRGGGSRGGPPSGGGMPGPSSSRAQAAPEVLIWIKNIKLATDK